MSCAIAEGPDERREATAPKAAKPKLISHFRDDEPRSAFGQGWEDRRENMPVTSNPFSPVAQAWQWQAYRDGWFGFKPIANKGA